MLSNPSYVLLLLTLSINTSVLNAEQLVLESILKTQQYSDSFCGTLIAHAYFFGTFFMLMGAAWVDNSANYVKVSRISCVISALSIATFSISIILPNIKNVILVTNAMASFGCSLMYPALFQVALRSANSILPEATVAAIIVILQQSSSAGLMNLFGPLRALSPTPGGYQAPMLIFSCIVILINFLYVTSFRAPSREELQRRLRSDDRELIVDQEHQISQ